MNSLPELTDEELLAQYDKQIEFIKETFGETSDRTKNILQLYEDLKFQIINAPASGKLNYHLAMRGGYIMHVNNVIKCALKMTKTYKEMDGILDFSKEELIMAALVHDLGKIGDESGTYYLEETSDWHKKNMGRMFKFNEEIPFMAVRDRTLYLLQKYNIVISKNEFLGISLSDGVFNSANEQYLKYEKTPNQVGSLPFIIHMADYMSSKVEKDLLRV